MSPDPSCSVMIWNLSCSGIWIVSTIARWTDSESARRNSGVVPLRRAMRTSGIPGGMASGSRGFAAWPARLGLRPQVERLPPGQRQEAVLRERHSLTGVLHARPGEQRIEVVAAVHEERAGLDLRADAEGPLLVAGPDSRGQAVGAVVHQPDGLVVVGHLLDADDRAEALLHHQP